MREVHGLNESVASGQATAPTRTGRLTMPPVVDDPEVDVAAELVAARDEERW